MLKDLEDFDEWNIETELQVDVTVENPQETAEEENISSNMKCKADVDNIVPDGSDTNQPGILICILITIYSHINALSLACFHHM